MTILQLISSAGFYGAESMLVSLSDSLARLDCKVIVGVLRDGRDTHVEVADAAARLGLKTRQIPCSGRFDLKTIGHIRKLFQDDEIDLVHAHGYKADIFAFLASWPGRLVSSPQRVSLVSTCHNWPNPARKMQTYAVLDRMILKGFDHVTTPSPLVADVLRESGIKDNHITWIRNGVDTGRYQSPAPILRQELQAGNRPIIGFVGRMVPAKGGEEFLEAAKIVLETHPNALFVLAGDGPSREPWKALATKLGIAHSVFFAGVMQDMPGVYASFDVMTLPSHEEAMPMCLLEAMAASRASIATSVGAVPELITNNETGLLIEPHDAKALADATLQLLADPAARERMGEQARERVVRQYSATAMARTYLGLYQRCTNYRGMDRTPVHEEN